jgi:hypothetical protein
MKFSYGHMDWIMNIALGKHKTILKYGHSNEDYYNLPHSFPMLTKPNKLKYQNLSILFSLSFFYVLYDNNHMGHCRNSIRQILLSHQI